MLNNMFRKVLFFVILPTLLLSTSASASGLLLGDRPDVKPLATPAQLSVELGGREREVIRRLRRAGYKEIRIVKSGFVKVRAEACFDGSRYRITVKRLGMRISRNEKIGTCRTERSLDEVIAKLRSRGYTRISATEDRNGDYNVTVCDRNRRIRLIIDRFGEIVRRKDLGKCRRRDGFADVRQSLRDEGFNRIQMVERTRRGYIVEACQRGRKYELRTDKRGRIQRERRIGRCGGAINPRDIPNILAKRGFDRIRVIDARLPGYRAEACRRDTRLEILMNRYGQIRNVQVLGDCEPPITRNELKRVIRKIGLNRTSIKDVGGRGFIITGCLGLDKMEYHIDPYGDTFRRVIIGRCSPPPRINQVLRDFRKNKKLDDVEIYVEGCRRGKLLRFKLNRYGQVVDRQRAGRCR